MALRMRCTAALATILAVAGLVEAEDDGQAIYEELFGVPVREARQSRGTADDLAVAEQMLGSVDQLKAHPALVIHICDEVYDLVYRLDDGLELATQAMDKLAEHNADRTDHARRRMLEAHEYHYRRVRRTDGNAGDQLCELYVDAADAWFAERRYDLAAQAYSKASPLNRKAKVLSDDELKRRELTSIQLSQALTQLDNLRRRLERTPDNARLHHQIVELALLQLGDLSLAAAHAPKAGDEQMARFAPLMDRPLDELEPAAWVDLAEWYETSARSAGAYASPVLLRHARDAYGHYVTTEGEQGLLGLKAKVGHQRVVDALAALEAADEAPHNKYKGKLVAACDDAVDIYVNDKRIMGGDMRSFSPVPVTLETGDVITARCRNFYYQLGFFFMFVSDDGGHKIVSRARDWKSYQPTSSYHWWKVQPDGELPNSRKVTAVDKRFNRMVGQAIGAKWGGSYIIWGHTASEYAYLYHVVK